MSKFTSLQKLRTLHRGNYGTLHGNFFPLHKEKYVGPSNIVFRSSWEKKLMEYLDRNPNVTEWNSEGMIVQYTDPTRLDDEHKPTVHKYFVDFNATIKQKDGTLRKFSIEVKPSAQCHAPIKTKKTDEKAFMQRMITFLRNQAKWAAANKASEQRGMKFIILTERELNIK
jgi:hypothetical protein